MKRRYSQLWRIQEFIYYFLYYFWKFNFTVSIHSPAHNFFSLPHVHVFILFLSSKFSFGIDILIFLESERERERDDIPEKSHPHDYPIIPNNLNILSSKLSKCPLESFLIFIQSYVLRWKENQNQRRRRQRGLFGRQHECRASNPDLYQ